MSQSTPRWRQVRRAPLLVAAGALAAAGVGWLIWFGPAGASDAGNATGTPTPSSSAEPSAAPTPTPSAVAPAAPEPAATAPPAGTVSDPAGDAPDQSAVPEREVVELPAVGLTQPADFGNDVTARLTKTTRVDGVGQGVGERSGPSMLLEVEFTNGSSAVVDLDYLVVNLYDPAGAAGQTLLGDSRSAPMSGKLAPGESRSGSYVLRLPDPAVATVTVTVSYGADTPTAVFTGKVAT